MRIGFAFLHRISWDPFNEVEDLIPQARKYMYEQGCYPERICADRIYITTKNRNLCTSNNIRLSGKRLGRPPIDPEINAAHTQKLSADQRRRSEVEVVFGSGKRKYSLRLILARLTKDANLDFSEVSGDVRREDSEAPPPLFCHFLCLDLLLAMARILLGAPREHLPT